MDVQRDWVLDEFELQVWYRGLSGSAGSLAEVEEWRVHELWAWMMEQA